MSVPKMNLTQKFKTLLKMRFGQKEFTIDQAVRVWVEVRKMIGQGAGHPGYLVPNVSAMLLRIAAPSNPETFNADNPDPSAKFRIKESSVPSMRSVFRLTEAQVKKSPAFKDTAIAVLDGVEWYIWTHHDDTEPSGAPGAKPKITAYEIKNVAQGMKRRRFDLDLKTKEIVYSTVETVVSPELPLKLAHHPWKPDQKLIEEFLVAYDEALEKGLVREPIVLKHKPRLANWNKWVRSNRGE